MRGFTRRSPLQASAQTRQPQFHCGTPPPAAEPSTNALNRGADPLAGDIVEARRNVGRAAGRRWEVSRLHQRARRRVEIGVARGSGDRKRSDRPRGADGEGDADDALRAPGAGGGRVEHAAADGGAHLADIGRKRRGARRRTRWRACRRSAARCLGERWTRLSLSRSGRAGSAWTLLLPGPSALQPARADEALAERVRPHSGAGVQARPEREAAEARAEAVEVAPRAAAAQSAVVVPVTEEEAARRPGAAVLAAAEARVARRRGAALEPGLGQVQQEPVRHLAAAQAAQSWIARAASTLRQAAPEFPWAGLPAEYQRSPRPAVRACSASE